MRMHHSVGLAVVGGLIAGSASAALTGSGSHLPIPSPNVVPANQPRSVATTSNGFTGTWTAPALPAWVGTFNALGPIPAGTSNPTGFTEYDFTSLPNSELPAGTFFRFGDVDTGSATVETFTLKAFGGGGGLIATPWLDGPIAVSGTGTGSGGSVQAADVPGWSWTASTGEYFIDGSTVGGNPNAAVWLTSNTDMSFLSVERTSGFSSFSLAAPVPAPSVFSLLALGVPAMTRRRRGAT